MKPRVLLAQPGDVALALSGLFTSAGCFDDGNDRQHKDADDHKQEDENDESFHNAPSVPGLSGNGN
ncbi:MAG TPA: hypothetical protein DIT64_19290 [Verrucomicrobiales bacterium]|nr:hypothetical protein [Verrucomicrobiales bacterium]